MKVALAETLCIDIISLQLHWLHTKEQTNGQLITLQKWHSLQLRALSGTKLLSMEDGKKPTSCTSGFCAMLWRSVGCVYLACNQCSDNLHDMLIPE